MCLLCQHWGGEDRRLSRAQWPVSFTKLMSSGPSERPCLKIQSGQLLRNNTESWPLVTHTCTHTNMYLYECTYMYTCKYTQKVIQALDNNNNKGKGWNMPITCLDYESARFQSFLQSDGNFEVQKDFLKTVAVFCSLAHLWSGLYLLTYMH